MTQSLQEKPRATRLARIFLPDIDPQSEILPDDAWFRKNIRDILKTNKAVRNATLRVAGYPLLALASAGLGVICAAIAFPATAAVAGALALGAAAAAFCGYKTKAALKSFKDDALPELRAEAQVRYLKLKGSEIARAWKAEIDKYRANPAAAEPPAVGAENPSVNPAPAAKPAKGISALRRIFTNAQKLKEIKTADNAAKPAEKPPAP